MRRLLVALGLIGFVSPAFAADYALPTLRGSDTYVPAPPAYRWAGFYGGVQIGYSISQMDFGDGLGSMVGDILRNSTLARDVSNWTVLGHSSTARTPFGGFVGYNFQWDETVFGLEGNYNHVSLTRSLADSVSRTFIDNTGAPPNTTYQYNVTAGMPGNSCPMDSGGWPLDRRMLPAQRPYQERELTQLSKPCA